MTTSVAMAKLTRPKSGQVLQRQRLFAQMSPVFGGPSLVFLHAPAGSGKTTLATSYSEHLRVPTLWYRVDAGDEDLASLFLHLRLAASALRPAAVEHLPALNPEFAPGVDTFSRRFFRRLVELMGSSFLLVFDDCHEVADDSSLFDFLRSAADELPRGSHLLMLSRRPPPAKLARLRASSSLVELDSDALALTGDEAVSMTRLHERGDLTNDDIDRMRARVGAWVTGFVLALRSPPRGGGPEPSALAQSGLLFDYFSAEAWQGLPDADQERLIRVALLPWMTAQGASIMTGDPRTPAVLESMARSRQFTTCHGQPTPVFRFHPLFREFLLQRAAETLPVDAMRDLQVRAAEQMDRDGAPAEAMVLVVRAQAWQHARELIRRNAPALLSEGRHKSLAGWLEAIPAELVECDATLSRWLGTALLPEDPEAAYTHFKRAYHLALDGADAPLVVLSWAGMVDAVFKGFRDFARVDEAFAEFEQHVAQRLDRLPITERGKVIAIAFLALVFRQPNHPRVAAWMRPIRFMSRLVPDRLVRHLLKLQLATSHLWRGELAAAHAIAKRLQAPSREFESDPFSAIVVALIQASCHLHFGRPEDCLAAVELGLELAQRCDLHIWDLTLYGIGAASCLGAGNNDRARGLIASMDERLNEERVVEHSHMLCLMAWRDLADGRPRSALEIVDLALDTVARGGVPYFQGISLLVAADVYARTERLEEAGFCLDQVVQAISMTGNSMLEWMRQLLRARVADARGDRECALAALAAGLRLGREHGYMHFYFWPRDTLSALFDLALARRIEPGYVQELIVHNRMSSPVPGHAVFEWPWPVRVYTLGPFRIELDGLPMTFTGKIQKAPLKMLKILIALGGHNVAEHMVVDALWPDSPGDAGQQALATTLKRLRKLIGPTAILRQDGKLSIQREWVWCDVQALADSLNRSDPDLPTALTAICALYGGRFLSCDDSIACAAPMRERMHQAVTSALLDAARGAAAAGRHESTVGLCEQGLRIDDLFEGFYALAMQSLVETGRCADAVLMYRRCQRALSALLGVAPSPATHQIFLSALAGAALGSP